MARALPLAVLAAKRPTLSISHPASCGISVFRQAGWTARRSSECRSDAGDHRRPVAAPFLAKDAQCRVPRAVLAPAQPAPAIVVAVEQEHRLSQRACKVHDRG